MILGSQVLCTFAFLQAIATKSFICYTLHEDIDKTIYNRINRYCKRGFIFLEPQQFNDLSYFHIMLKTVVEMKTEQRRQIVNSNGEKIEATVIISEPRRVPFLNVDTYLLQEVFIKQIQSQSI